MRLASWTSRLFGVRRAAPFAWEEHDAPISTSSGGIGTPTRGARLRKLNRCRHPYRCLRQGPRPVRATSHVPVDAYYWVMTDDETAVGKTSDIRRVHGHPVPAKPPWKVMGLIVGVGLGVVLLGILSSSNVMIAIGAVLAFSAVLGFLVPGLRYVHQPQQVDRESYFGFVVGLLRDRPGRRDGRRERRA
jgi:hypothetical protein